MLWILATMLVFSAPVLAFAWRVGRITEMQIGAQVGRNVNIGATLRFAVATELTATRPEMPPPRDTGGTGPVGGTGADAAPVLRPVAAVDRRPVSRVG